MRLKADEHPVRRDPFTEIGRGDKHGTFRTPAIRR